MTRARRAFTLTEALVFGTLALMVFALVFGVLRSTSRESAITQRHLKGLQGVSVLIDRLELDLRSAIYFKNPLTDRELQLEPDASGHAVSFYRYEIDPLKLPAEPVSASGEVRPVPVQRVRYAFDPATGAVTRQVGAGKPELLSAARYRSVKFARAAPAPGTPAAPGPLDRAASDFLRLEVTWAPEEVRATAAPDQETLVFRTLFGLTGEAVMSAHQDRTLNPTSRFSVEDLPGL